MPTVTEILATMDYGPAPEASDIVTKWLKAKGPFGHYIGGAFTKPGRTFAVKNPATGEKIADVTQGTAADVAAAVKAARAALPGWSKLPGHERAKWLYAIARTIQKRERFLAVLEVIDNGKPIRETRDIDVPLVARHFYHHAGWAEMLADEFPGAKPVGVCGQIIPWNFPLLMLAWKIAPALGGGEHGGAEARRIHAADGAGLCRNLCRGRAAEGRGEHRHGRRRDRGGAGGSGGGQGGVHRIDRSGPRDPHARRRGRARS